MNPLSISFFVDTKQLDQALEKLKREFGDKRLIEVSDWNALVEHVARLERERPLAASNGVLTGAAVAGCALAGSTRRLTRRSLLGLKFLRRV